MRYERFILSGVDRKVLSNIKNALVVNNYLYVGYSKEPCDILRHIRRHTPDLVIIEEYHNFNELKQTIEVIDDELLAACILILDSRDKNIIGFLKGLRVTAYIIKPVFDENIIQITDISLTNYRRIVEYEEKVRKLNNTIESRKIIERAKWILVEQQRYSELEAYEVIKRKSRDNRIPMRDIAEAIIITRSINSSADSEETSL